MTAIEPFNWLRFKRPPEFDWTPGGVSTDCEGKSFTLGATVKLERPALAFDDKGYRRGIWETGAIVKISGVSEDLNVAFFEGEFEGQSGIEWANGAIPAGQVRVRSEK